MQTHCWTAKSTSPSCSPNSRQLATETFSHAEAAQEWNQEAALRVNGALDNFDVMRSQFGVRNGSSCRRSCKPQPVAAGWSWRIVAGLALLGALALAARRIAGRARRGAAGVGGVQSSLIGVVRPLVMHLVVRVSAIRWP